MIILKTKNYKKNVSSLVKKDRVLLSKQEKLLAENIFHSQLHTKKLKGFPEEHIYSVNTDFFFCLLTARKAVFLLKNCK